MDYLPQKKLREIIKDTALEHIQISEVPVQGLSHSLLAFTDIPINNEFSWDLWHLLRDMISETGCWPVMLLDDEIETLERDGFECSIQDIQSPFTGGKKWFEEYEEILYEDKNTLEDLERTAAFLQKHYGVSPSTSELKNATSPDGKSIMQSQSPELESDWWDQWLRNKLGEKALIKKYQEEFHEETKSVPFTEEIYNIILLPDPSHTAPALLNFFGTSNYGGKAGAIGLAAALDHWYQNWGAECVSHWGIILDFHVKRPPETLDQAKKLYYEHATLGPNTVDGRGPRWSYQQHLVNNPTWEIYWKP